MIISNSNAAKAKQKMSSYSRRGAKAGRAPISSYLLDNAIIKVGDKFSSGTPIYLSEDYAENLLAYFDPETEQLVPHEDTIILASFSLDNPGEIASFDVDLEWNAEFEQDPGSGEVIYYNYMPRLYMIFRNSVGAELRRIELSMITNIGKISYNANITASYVHYIFDAVVSKVRLGGYTEDALNIKQDEVEGVYPFVQRLKDNIDVAGKTLKFSNEFFEIFDNPYSSWSFARNCCLSSGATPAAGVVVPLVRFDASVGESRALYLYINNPDNNDFAIILDTYDHGEMTIAKYATNSNGEGAWIIDNVCYSFPSTDEEVNPIAIITVPTNVYFWNTRSDLITVSSNYNHSVDTNIFYTSIITGIGPAKYDTEQMLNRLLDPDVRLKQWNISSSDYAAGLRHHVLLFIDTTNLDPQYGFEADVFCLPLVNTIGNSSEERQLIFNIHSYDDTTSLIVTIDVSDENGLEIQDVTTNGITVPLEYLDQLRWCIGIIQSGQGFKRPIGS